MFTGYCITNTYIIIIGLLYYIILLYTVFRLGYANSSDVIELKGRVACEIDSYVFISFAK